MSAFSAPTTPENAAARMRPAAFRSFTVPSKVIDNTSRTITPATSSPVPNEKDIESLYTCVNAKIVAFDVPKSMLASTPGRGSAGTKEEALGTLPWKFPGERTMAAGPLYIYRVKSSGIAFFKSGSFLHPTMPLSRCWCVDGESKFVLRVRDDLFYRIELPSETEEDKADVEELRTTLPKMLRYERTPCPFQRGFHVDLPEIEDSPSRIRVVQSEHPQNKKRWLDGVWMPEGETPRQSSAPAGADRKISASEASTGGDVTDGSGRTQDSDDESSLGQNHHSGSAVSGPQPGPALEDESQGTDDEAFHGQDDLTLPESPFAKRGTALSKEPRADVEAVQDALEHRLPDPVVLSADTVIAGATDERPRNLLYSRSITEPLLRGNGNITSDEEKQAEPDSFSANSRRTSFHTASDEEAPGVNGIAPEESHAGEEGIVEIPMSRRPQHTRDVSEITITGSSDRPTTAGDNSNTSLSPPPTPTLTADDDVDDQEWHDAVTPPDTLRLRRPPKSQPREGASSSVDSSSASASQAVFAPRSHSAFSSSISGKGKELTAALIRKAYLLLRGPSASLVALMLQIAAKIVNGANIFHSYDLGREMDGLAFPAAAASVRPINTEDPDDWDEDDFGIPLGNTVSNASRSSSLSRDRVISRGRQRTPNEIWGISQEEESPGAAARREEVD